MTITNHYFYRDATLSERGKLSVRPSVCTLYVEVHVRWARWSLPADSKTRVCSKENTTKF